ncbi:hypothetical protein HDV06_002156 [Boothiomyces sp. JEL0866]|nr:hypothetical protein HDV06_002156 [Boothiomyces sp. JEL0866]
MGYIEPWMDTIQEHPALIGHSHNKYKRNLIQEKDGEVFVACKQEIRLFNLLQWKRTFIGDTKASYKILINDRVDFDINELLINDQGRLLAIVEKNHLVVSVIPLARPENQQLVCENYKIGSTYFSSSDIVKIMWHPFSATNSHLLVLVSSGILYMFDVTKDIHDPEQTFHLIEHFPKKGTIFGANLDEFETTTFTIGEYSSPNCGWTCITVYAMLKSGDIVSVSPVLPNNSNLPVEWLKATFDKVVLDWEKETNTKQEIQYYWTHRWLNDLLEASRDGKPQVRPLQEMELARTAPWLIKPNSEFLTSFGNSSDILVLSTDLCPLVVVTYDSGELVTGIVVELPKPIWKIEENQLEFPPMLFVHESVSLFKPKESIPAHLHYNAAIPDGVFVKSNRQLCQIQLQLRKYLNDSEKADQITSTNALCKIRRLVDTQKEYLSFNSSYANGMCLIGSLALGPSFVCLSSKGSLVMDIIYNMYDEPAIPKSNLKVLTSVIRQKKPNIDDIPIATKLTTKSAPYPEFVSEKTVKDLTRGAETTRENIQKLFDAYGDLREWSYSLEQEGKNHETIIQTSKETLQRISTSIESYRQRQQIISQRFQKQHQRMSTIIEILFDLTQLELSSAEISWINNLQHLWQTYSQVYLPKYKQYQARTDELKLELNILQPPPAEILGEKQIRDVKANLSLEYQELVELDDLMKKLCIDVKAVETKISLQ